ncbi:hypothetical protein KY304_00060 [Candidatus Woesearchaeota archaeon]|nr:hypothetical protein [Candidatus Woesearchaeota archaeon]MBW2978490.1 hypothetical protein [Candidatus Woesearchaeota archaeon]
MKINPKILTITSIFVLVMLITTPFLVSSMSDYYDDYYYEPYDNNYYEPYDDTYYELYDDTYYEPYDNYYILSEEPEVEAVEAIAEPAEPIEWTYDDFDYIFDPADTDYSHYPYIGPEDFPTFESDEEEPLTTIKEKGLRIQITGTRMPSEINAGEQLLLRVYLKNNGDEHIDNLKITLVNQELALRDSVGPLDLRKGHKASKILLLDFPDSIQPGYYYLRINIHANGIDRVVYRDIYVK